MKPGLLILATVLSVACSCLAQFDPRKVVTLEPLPVVQLLAHEPATEAEAARIRALIDDLTLIENPDFGLSSTMSGRTFAPVPQLATFGGGLIQIDHGIEGSSALLELVKIGPRAIPFLLDALQDARPTRLTIKHNQHFGSMSASRELDANPANEREWAAAQRASVGLDPVGRAEPGRYMTDYQVTVGDACFVALGQITGRTYSAVRYQPTACIVINSPSRDPKIAEMVRDTWSAPDPARALLDSLLLDFCTRARQANEDEDPGSWYEIARFQVTAATRLVYYFPEQTAALIAARLDGLDVSTPGNIEDAMRQEAANGVRVDEFIEAVSWCIRSEIRGALRRVMQRTDSPSLFRACLPSADPGLRNEDVAALLAFLDKVPPDEGGPYGEAYHLLIAIARLDMDAARPVYAKCLKVSNGRRRSMCLAVREVAPPWGCKVVAPLLNDKRPALGWSYAIDPADDSKRLPIRLCDEAAETIAHLDPDVQFELRGTHEELDAAIAKIKEALAAKGVK